MAKCAGIESNLHYGEPVLSRLHSSMRESGRSPSTSSRQAKARTIDCASLERLHFTCKNIFGCRVALYVKRVQAFLKKLPKHDSQNIQYKLDLGLVRRALPGSMRLTLEIHLKCRSLSNLAIDLNFSTQGGDLGLHKIKAQSFSFQVNVKAAI